MCSIHRHRSKRGIEIDYWLSAFVVKIIDIVIFIAIVVVAFIFLWMSLTHSRPRSFEVGRVYTSPTHHLTIDQLDCLIELWLSIADWFLPGVYIIERLLILFPPCPWFSSPRHVALRYKIYEFLLHKAIEQYIIGLNSVKMCCSNERLPFGTIKSIKSSKKISFLLF